MPTSNDSSTISTGREIIAKQLATHSWFRATDPAIQAEVISLPEDYDGFLTDLASRPDEIGELDVLRLVKIGYGNFLILPVFEVRSNITNQIFTYEYASWKTGANPGVRGIIFIENKGKITHFLVSVIHKFSTAKEVYESIGGTYLRFFDNKLHNLPKKMEKEIGFHLGIEELKFKQVVSLGKAHPDTGMTNNVSDLFAAVIEVPDLNKVVLKNDYRSAHKPVGFEIKVIPISEFKKISTHHRR